MIPIVGQSASRYGPGTRSEAWISGSPPRGSAGVLRRGGAEAEAAASALAARGGGRAQTVHRLAEIGPALTRILT